MRTNLAERLGLEPEEETRERQERLESAVDRLRGKYGMGAVRFGASAPGKKEDSLL